MNAVNEGKFEVQSSLQPGQFIPKEYYGNAFGYSDQNLSPALAWRNVPAGTKSWAITFFDKDAPTESGFWHYVLFDVPADVHEIELGALSSGQIPKGAIENLSDAGQIGYLGPCPPAGREHTYVYTIHALKVEKLGVPSGSTPAFVSFNLWANSLGKASFTVKAGRKK
jgi:Raf kinase inhibitor-like YbhB/YbcL family protein